MRINIRFVTSLIIILILNIGNTFAKNNANSPYTRFGYGSIQDQTFSRSKGMGGISYGLRKNNTINPSNPASYSAIDSTTFLFEFGASGLLSTFSTQGANKTTLNGNLDYIAMQMPVTKWMGLSVGILPFSFVGYNYGLSDSIIIPTPVGRDSIISKYNQSFKGAGGISQVYLGMSFDLWDHLALGVNAYYMFGTIDHYRSLIFSDSGIGGNSISKHSSLYVNNFNFRFGLQYHETIGKKHDFTIGLAYEFQTPINGELTEKTVGTDTVQIISNNAFDLPSIYGLGFTYTYDKRLTIGLDATYSDFSNSQFYGVKDSLNSTIKLALGGEYIHNPSGNKYSDRILWRLGLNYYNSYANFNNKNAHNVIVTCGIGLPLRKSKTIINFNLEYGNTGIQAASLLKEQYLKFGINVTLNETWFIKTKIK